MDVVSGVSVAVARSDTVAWEKKKHRVEFEPAPKGGLRCIFLTFRSFLLKA